jgi:hypothetical protein
MSTAKDDAAMATEESAFLIVYNLIKVHWIFTLWTWTFPKTDWYMLSATIPTEA